MFYGYNQRYFNPFQPVQDQSFSLYTDEIKVLYDAAKQSGKKELTQLMEWLFTYSREKTSRSNGPVKFTFK